MNQPTTLSPEICHEIDHWIAQYPPEGRRSATLAALRIVQEHEGGWIRPESLLAVAEYLGLPPVAVEEVARFYSMYELKPTARHSVSVCTNVSCMLCGCGMILDHLEKRLGIRPGQATADGKIYLKPEEECLAACAGAPMMMVDHIYYEHLTPERVDEILESLE